MEKFPEEVGSLILSLAANAKGLWNVQAGRQMNPLEQQANENGQRLAGWHFANMPIGAVGNCTNNIWKTGQKTTSPSEQGRRA